MTERLVIEANVYLDGAGSRPLPRLIGPFDTREEAAAYMDAQRPIWGEWNTAPLFTPAPVTEGAERG